MNERTSGYCLVFGCPHQTIADQLCEHCHPDGSRIADLERQLAAADSIIAGVGRGIAADWERLQKVVDENERLERQLEISATTNAKMAQEIAKQDILLAEAQSDRDQLYEAARKSLGKLRTDGMKPGWGVVKDWLNAALVESLGAARNTEGESNAEST